MSVCVFANVLQAKVCI